MRTPVNEIGFAEQWIEPHRRWKVVVAQQVRRQVRQSSTKHLLQLLFEITDAKHLPTAKSLQFFLATNKTSLVNSEPFQNTHTLKRFLKGLINTHTYLYICIYTLFTVDFIRSWENIFSNILLTVKKRFLFMDISGA